MTLSRRNFDRSLLWISWAWLALAMWALDKIR